MHALRTAVIQHTTAHGTHHDWLIEDPRLPHPQAPGARLWTARVAPPPADWARLRRFMIEPIAPHRRAYLTYQGPVSGDRGWVKRVAKGACNVVLWTEGRIVIHTNLTGERVRIEMNRFNQSCWKAQLG